MLVDNMTYTKQNRAEHAHTHNGIAEETENMYEKDERLVGNKEGKTVKSIKLVNNNYMQRHIKMNTEGLRKLILVNKSSIFTAPYTCDQTRLLISKSYLSFPRFRRQKHKSLVVFIDG